MNDKTAQGEKMRNEGERNRSEKKKILVVDDSITFTKYVSRILQGSGFDIEIANNGFEGLEKAMRTKFDLIITDINMPRMDGYEFAREIRKIPDYKMTPIIAISTLSEYSERQKGFSAGIDIFITKPVSPSRLLQSVKALLGQMKSEEVEDEGKTS